MSCCVLFCLIVKSFADVTICNDNFIMCVYTQGLLNESKY